MNEARKQKKRLTGRKNEKSFALTDEALKVIAAAKEKGIKSSVFVSNCITAHGQLILGDQYPAEEKPSLNARLDYLEETLIYIAYNAIAQRLDDGSLSEHEKILDKHSSVKWYESLDELSNLAETNEKTKDTKKYEWQTLIRKRELIKPKKSKRS